MNYKVILYCVFVFLSIYVINGININKFMKTNRIWEARLLVLCLSFMASYLLTNFVLDFIS